MSRGQGPFYPLGRGEDMSEGEYAALQAMDEDPDEDEIARDWPDHLNAPEGSWQTRDDSTVLIRDMTDKHVRNAIRWMKARALDDHPKFDELIAERDRRKLP